MTEFAVSVVGRDRPGIIAEVTAALAELGVNLTDSSMTLLRGHFAMTLVCTGPPAPAEVREALNTLTADGSLLVSVGEVTDLTGPATAGRPHVVTVHGADRLGLVAAVTRTLTLAGGNITDATSRLAGDLYLLIVEVDLPDDADTSSLTAQLAGVGARLDVDVTLRPADPDVL
ncbi:MAG: ACT domain-containing protein [Actinocatenispora sp.]